MAGLAFDWGSYDEDVWFQEKVSVKIEQIKAYTYHQTLTKQKRACSDECVASSVPDSEIFIQMVKAWLYDRGRRKMKIENVALPIGLHPEIK